MKSFSLSSLATRFAATAGFGCLSLLGNIQPASASIPINPAYNTTFTETYENTPAGAPIPSSFGYFFETTVPTKLTGLGIPFFAGWANTPGSPTNFPNASTFDVYIWRIDGINQPSLDPCDGSTPYCQVKKVTFDQNQTGNYTIKDGYYWQTFDPIYLGPETTSDVNLQYAIAAVGNFSLADGLPTPVGGTGTFDPAFSWTGNGFNASAPFYSPDYSGDFPVPWNYTSDPISADDPQTFYAYFSPNLSYTLVPSPLPLLGAGAAYGWARRLRRRVEMAGMRTLG